MRQLGGRQLLAAEARRGEAALGAALALGRGPEEEGKLQVLRRVGADLVKVKVRVRVRVRGRGRGRGRVRGRVWSV